MAEFLLSIEDMVSGEHVTDTTKGYIYFGASIGVLLVLESIATCRGPLSSKMLLLGALIWVSSGLAFNLGLYFMYDAETAADWFMGYLLEYTLSFDNLFVFYLIFKGLQTPAEQQPLAVLLGQIMALVFRIVFTFAGVLLLSVNWINILLGAFVIITGIKTAFEDDDDDDMEQNRLMKCLRACLPISPNYDGNKMFTRDPDTQRCQATPLLVAILFMGLIDIFFSIDSVSAKLAVIEDQYILYTSTVFGVLGLRTLFFVIIVLLNDFFLLQYGISLVLVLLGVSLLLQYAGIETNNLVQVCVICSILSCSVLLSMVPSIRKCFNQPELGKGVEDEDEDEDQETAALLGGEAPDPEHDVQKPEPAYVDASAASTAAAPMKSGSANSPKHASKPSGQP